MEQSSLSKWLKSIAIGIGTIGLIIYFCIIPLWGKELVRANHELARCYFPWLIFIWITGIPCFLVLIEFWKICCEIGRDNSFSKQNINSLKRISQLLIIDSIILFVGNVILFFAHMNHLGVALIMLFIMFAGIAVAIGSASLSHLVLKAYKMKEENDLTI